MDDERAARPANIVDGPLPCGPEPNNATNGRLKSLLYLPTVGFLTKPGLSGGSGGVTVAMWPVAGSLVTPQPSARISASPEACQSRNSGSVAIRSPSSRVLSTKSSSAFSFGVRRKNSASLGRRAIEDLIKSRSHLAHMSQVMTIAELSASIAHEVNQPLASLVANGHACVSWLSADPPNLERARITAGRVIRDANTAAQVVQRIRALFRQAPPSMVATDLNEIVQEAMGLIGNEIVDAGVVVTTDLAPTLPRVVVDRVQIQQALVNLARNALEAMKSVTDREKRLSILCRQDGTNVLIQVRDTGSGIPNPTAIFDPFFTTKESGMGMGLAICRSIVDAHGGRLWAVQNDGPGATFSLTLPISAEF